MKISAVINTHNEEKNLPRCLKSIHGLVDEIVVVDMDSTDKTREIAKKYNARVYSHLYVGYVEPARNFALEKAKGDWILLIDADEVVSSDLLEKLKNVSQHSEYYFVRIPRKNIIFNHWIKHTGWWPDYQIRFFRKGAVSWGNDIHSIPITKGRGFDIAPHEKNAFVHYNYQTISQFIDRLNRYTSIEAQEIFEETANFSWGEILRKPWQEFLQRFFQLEGYKDGLHGLVLSLLQAVSVLVVQLKIWEQHKFQEVSEKSMIPVFKSEQQRQSGEFLYWFFHKKAMGSKGFLKSLYKVRSRLRI